MAKEKDDEKIAFIFRCYGFVSIVISFRKLFMYGLMSSCNFV